MSDPRDPMLLLARRIARRQREKPNLVGPSSAAGSNLSEPQFNLPQGSADQILVMVDTGGGVLIPQWQDPSGSGPGGGGGKYRHLVFVDDGAGGYGLVTATISGQTWPVTALHALE